MKTKNLLLIVGFSIISACASNEANMDSNENTAETMKDEAVTATQESKPEVQEVKEEATQTSVEAVDTTTEATETQDDTATSNSNNRKSTCENGSQIRVITAVYDNDATDTVCEVTYEKSSGVQTLWTANSDRDYCLDKAADFVQKQVGWGWTCSNLE